MCFRPESGIALRRAGDCLGGLSLGIRAATPLAKTIAGDLAKARRVLDAAAEKAELRYSRIRSESGPNLTTPSAI